MTHKDAGHYSDKRGPAEPFKPGIKEAIGARAVGGQISCEAAFRIVEEFDATPAEVGRAIDQWEIKIIRCQLGLFGYVEGKRSIVQPAESVSEELEAGLRKGLVDGKLPCATAWEIARHFSMPRMSITAACDKLDIRIKPCQLGTF